MIPKCPKHKRIKPKRAAPMDAMEKFHVERLVAFGCLVCGQPACYHHEKDGPGGKRDHKCGAPLCPDHHQYGTEARHKVSRERFNEILGFDLLEWCKRQWIETERMHDEKKN